MRHLYEMKCPVCHKTYQYEGEAYEIEHCPNCAYQGLFSGFVKETHLCPPFYNSAAQYIQPPVPMEKG